MTHPITKTEDELTIIVDRLTVDPDGTPHITWTGDGITMPEPITFSSDCDDMEGRLFDGILFLEERLKGMLDMNGYLPDGSRMDDRPPSFHGILTWAKFRKGNDFVWWSVLEESQKPLTAGDKVMIEQAVRLRQDGTDGSWAGD